MMQAAFKISLFTLAAQATKLTGMVDEEEMYYPFEIINYLGGMFKI